MIKKIKKTIFVWLAINRNRSIFLFMKDKFDFFFDAFSNNNNDHNTNGEFWLQQKVSKYDPKTIFDIGGNVGNWTLRMSQSSVKSEIHVFEPIPAVFEILEKNCFSFSSIITNNKALSDKEGLIEFSINLNNSIFSSFYDRIDCSNSIQTKVETTTGNNYCELNNIEEVDFIKIDVEGLEFDVLKGFLPLLKEGRIKVIQFEYGVMNIHSRNLLKDFYDLLIPLGFNIGKLFPQNIQFMDYKYSMEDFKWANYVAVHRSVVHLFD